MIETITVQAGGIFPWIGEGTLFVCISASADFRAGFGSSSPVNFRQGQRHGAEWRQPEPTYRTLAKSKSVNAVVRPESYFSRVTFYNNTASVITIEFYAGFEGFADSGTVVTTVAKQLRPYGSDVVAIADGVANDVAVAADADRDHAEVEHAGIAGSLQLVDQDNKVFGTVPAGSARVVIGGAAFKIRNVSGAAIDCFYGLWK